LLEPFGTHSSCLQVTNSDRGEDGSSGDVSYASLHIDSNDRLEQASIDTRTVVGDNSADVRDAVDGLNDVSDDVTIDLNFQHISSFV
jgi:hypothetical protein